MEKENYNKEQADMAFDMTNILKDTLQTQKGATIFGEGEAAHYCAKLAFEKISPLQSIISEQKAEIERLSNLGNELAKQAYDLMEHCIDREYLDPEDETDGQIEFNKAMQNWITKKEGNNG